MAQDRALQDTQETVRIPLYGEDATQVKAATIIGAASGQMFYNCFPVVYQDPTSEQGEKWIESRSGFFNHNAVNLASIVTNTASAIPFDAITMTSLSDVTVVAIYDAVDDDVHIIQYRTNADTVTEIGAINNVGATYNMSATSITLALAELDIAGVPTLGVTVWKNDYTASAAYYASSAAGVFGAGSLTEITDAQFPPKLGTPVHIVGRFVQMNGTTYVMSRDGKIYNSDLNSISSWNALGVKAAQTYPDRGLGLIRYKHHILAMGEETIEFFYDAGNAAPASPLNRQDQAFIKMGVQNPFAYINVQDVLYFISRDAQSNLAFWRLEGYTPVQLSQPPQNQLIKTGLEPHLVCVFFNNTQNIVFNHSIHKLQWPLVGNMNGSDTYPLTQEAQGLLTYCINSRAWWYFNVDAGSSHQLRAIYPATYVGQGVHNIIYWTSFNTSGSIYSCFPMLQFKTSETNVWHDTLYNAVSEQYFKIPVFFSTNTLDFMNEKRKRIHKYKIISTQYRDTDQAGEPYTTWDGANNYQYLFWSKKDPVTAVVGSLVAADVFTRSYNVAPASNTIHRYYASNLGSGRYWTFGFFQKLYLPMRFKCIELDVSQGTS